MSTQAEIRLWGNRIGVVSMDTADGIARFEYDQDFLRSGIEPSPITMPVADKVYRFPERWIHDIIHEVNDTVRQWPDFARGLSSGGSSLEFRIYTAHSRPKTA